MQPKGSEFIEIYQDTDNENRSSVEVPYFSRNNSQNGSSMNSQYRGNRYVHNKQPKIGTYCLNSFIKFWFKKIELFNHSLVGGKKKLRSANPNTFKIAHNLYQNDSNKSID